MHRAGLLGELRRVEWRRLLLACALLAVWARLLVPMAAQAAPMAAIEAQTAAICALPGDERGQLDLPATTGHDDRICPFCRVGEPALGMAPPPDVHGPAIPALVLRQFPLAYAPVAPVFHALAQPRGPPETTATL
jgi:hypothetical protein